MGDVRFEPILNRLRESSDLAKALQEMSTDEVIQALGAASRINDPYWANILVTETRNRVSTQTHAIEQLSTPVYVVDGEGQVVYINVAATAALGIAESEFLRRAARDTIALREAGDPRVIIFPSDGADIDGLTLREGEDGMFRCADGHEMLVSYSIVPLVRQDAVMGAIVSFRDITRRRELERALATRERLFRELVEINSDAIVLVDRGGVVRYVNPAAESLFARSAPELLGVTIGVPSVDHGGSKVDISAFDGTWNVAELRTIEMDWDGEPMFVSIFHRPIRTA